MTSQQTSSTQTTAYPERWHEYMYEQTRPSVEMMGGVMPKWDQLTEQQRINIRVYNEEYQDDLNNVVKGLNNG